MIHKKDKLYVSECKKNFDERFRYHLTKEYGTLYEGEELKRRVAEDMGKKEHRDKFIEIFKSETGIEVL